MTKCRLCLITDNQKYFIHYVFLDYKKQKKMSGIAIPLLENELASVGSIINGVSTDATLDDYRLFINQT